MEVGTLKTVKIAVVGSGLSEEVFKKFITNDSSRRPRIFSGSNGSNDKRTGEIQYGDQYSIPVEIARVDRTGEVIADWYVLADSLPERQHFTSCPKRISRLLRNKNLPKGKLLVLNGKQDMSSSRIAQISRNAANHLGAEITAMSAFRPAFLSFPKGEGSKHFQVVSDWVKNDQKFQIVSGCCLNANESRRGIVNQLSTEITELLARTAEAAFDQLPITDWYIYTFGPKDYDFLGDLGIQKVLLPYMWNAPRDQVMVDMQKNFELITELGKVIQSRVGFPVTVGQLSDHAAEVDLPWLVEASRERAKKMLPLLMAEPPAIFAQLESEQDVFDRIQQEAFLYLLDTITWGQKEGEERPRVLAAGLEVHGGYWAHGNLFEGPNGEFMPLSWLPQCVRQHWGPWVLLNRTLKKERERLNYMLHYHGY